MSTVQNKLTEVLRCPGCQSLLTQSDAPTEGEGDANLTCANCGEVFPVIRGIPRLLLQPLRDALLGEGVATGTAAVEVATAQSFGFEWTKFPEMYQEWNDRFLSYMQPHSAEFFAGKRVLDAGCGNGRFAHYAGKYGAEVWALDLGPAVEVARKNTERSGNVQVVQADLHRPPFALESFDFIYSLGVLHHLPDPEPAFRNLLKFLKPGGEVQIYLYWKPEGQPFKRAMLAGVAAVRKLTTAMPHNAIHALSYPAAVAAFAFFVWPYRILKKVPGMSKWAEKFPMKQYSDYPFRVCINDQFDRLSAPIENRYTRREVADWLNRAALEQTQVNASFGWVGTAVKPRRTKQAMVREVI